MSWWSRLLWWRAPCQLRTVIVNLQDDPTTAIRGVLWSERGPWFVLRNAELLKANIPSTDLDGETLIHRTNISFVQVLP